VKIVFNNMQQQHGDNLKLYFFHQESRLLQCYAVWFL
jgi:hypothetical protein